MAIFGKRTEDLRAQTHDFRHLELQGVGLSIVCWEESVGDGTNEENKRWLACCWFCARQNTSATLHSARFSLLGLKQPPNLLLSIQKSFGLVL